MSSIADVLNQAKKQFGSGFSKKGSECAAYERQPTGIFPLDLMLGGGIPIGKISMVVGPESSGKTNCLLSTIGQYQKLNKDKQAVLIDAEHAFDPIWAAKLGVDVERLELVVPVYAEQVVDIVEGLAYAKDCGFIGIDSIAAMSPENEVESEAGKAQVGGNSRDVGKMMRKLTAAMIKMADHDHYPTVMLLNQIRFKIGVMMGNPETFPGGQALRHYCNMILRCYGKDIMENAVSKNKPSFKQTSITMKKWKCPIAAVNCEYKMAVIPQKGMPVGSVAAWNTVVSHAKDQGLLVKGKTAWNLLGEDYKTLVDAEQAMLADPHSYHKLQQLVIAEALRKSDLPPEADKT